MLTQCVHLQVDGEIFLNEIFEWKNQKFDDATRDIAVSKTHKR